jgi:hypothetical protein
VQPKRRSAPAAAKIRATPTAPREIVARYPNHVRSVDRTRVLRRGIWPTWVLVAIDHFSRKVVVCCPLEGPNAGWVVGAIEDAFVQHGAPRHLTSDQEGIFISDASSPIPRSPRSDSPPDLQSTKTSARSRTENVRPRLCNPILSCRTARQFIRVPFSTFTRSVALPFTGSCDWPERFRRCPKAT